MRRRLRAHYTDAQKTLTWERWKNGETLHQIARLLGCITRVDRDLTVLLASFAIATTPVMHRPWGLDGPASIRHLTTSGKAEA